jgi:HEAT repeat protein
MGFVKQRSSEAVDQDERKRPRDCESLAHQLTDPNPTARRWAARDLVECPEASGILLERLMCEEDSAVREVILTSLTCLGDREAVTGLVKCLSSEDAALRNEAIEAMKELPDEVVPIMGGLLKDSDPDVRIFAVNILESLRHPDVEKWLVDVIENDSQVNVCATAVDLLSEVGTSYSMDALKRLKTRFPDEPYILFAADLALKSIIDN